MVRSNTKWSAALVALAVAGVAAPRSASAQCRFQRSGTEIQKDGARFRAVGVNKFDLGLELQGAVGNRSRELAVDMAVKALGDMEDRGAPFVRFSSWGYGREDFLVWKNDPATWAARFTELCDRARDRGVFLVPTLCWNLQALSDLTGEPQGTIVRDPGSQGWQNLRDFTRDIVTRFKDRPEILMWELTNELNLLADLDLTARGGKPGDNFTTDDMIGFVRRFAQEIRAIDPARPITTGYGSPRTSAAHLRRAPEFSGQPDWRADSEAELQGYVRDTHPDPIDVVSMHPYDAEVQNVAKYKRASDAAGKPLFAGEFASSQPTVSANPTAAAQTFRDYLAQFELNGVALAAVWDFEFFQFDPSEIDPFGLVPNVNDDQLSALRAYNERSGAVSPLAPTPTAPRAIVSRPLEGAVVNAGTNVPVYVHASDRGTIASVELLVDGQSAGATAQYPFQLPWTAVAPGPHTLVARVRNAAGLTTDSKPVHVTVPGAAPVTPPSLLTLNGTGAGLPIGWVQRHRADGSLVGYEGLLDYDWATGAFTARSIDLNAAAGDRVFVCVYAKNASGRALTATVGGQSVTVAAAPTGYPGFDQVNIELPARLAGRGTVDLVVTADGAPSNAVQIAVK